MRKNKLIFFLLAAFIFLFWLSLPYYSGDIKNHLVWAQSILEFGPFGFYERDFPGFAFPNYSPLAMFLFTASLGIFYWMKDTVSFLNSNISIFPSNLVYFFEWENTKIAFLKLPAIVANILIVVSLYKLVPRKKYFAMMFFLFNPATFYLSSVWGQIDLLPIAFLLLSIILLLKKRFIWSAVLISLALLSKQTSIIFLPIFLVWVYKDFGIKKMIMFLFVSIAMVFVFYLPFHQPSLVWLVDLFQKNFDFVAHSIDENAINLWGFIYDFNRASDETRLGILTLQQWGYSMFLISMIYPIMLFLKRKLTLNSVILFFLIVSLSYFFFLTRMHERYLAPAIVFLTLFSFYNKKYLPVLIFFSILHFLNLYRGLLQPEFPLLNDAVNSVIVLKTLVIGYLGFLIYTFFQYIKDIKEND